MNSVSIEVLEDADAVFRRAATFIAERVRSCVDERGAFSLALSGGRVQPMLELLDAEDVPRDAVAVFQVDERVAPQGHEERNLTQIEAALTRATIVAMPVEDEDLPGRRPRGRMRLCCPTASTSSTSAVAPTATPLPSSRTAARSSFETTTSPYSREYNGRRRMTLTYPAIDRAREVLWVVTGEDKAEALAQFLAGSVEEIPATRVRTPVQTLLTDQAVTYS